MQKNKGTSKKNTLFANDLYSEFDIRWILRWSKQNDGTTKTNLVKKNLKKSRSDLIKNSLLVVAVITTIFLWIFDWSQISAYDYFFWRWNSRFILKKEHKILFLKPHKFLSFESIVEANQSLSAIGLFSTIEIKGFIRRRKAFQFDANQPL